MRGAECGKINGGDGDIEFGAGVVPVPGGDAQKV
jgi:hypothetical protein